LAPSLGFWGALVVAPVLTALIGLFVERVLVRRLYGRDPLYSLLLTFGLAFIFEDGTRYLWSPATVPFASEFFFMTGYCMFMVVLVFVTVLALFLILN
jgi:branched-chain amino acid transport system permease protein